MNERTYRREDIDRARADWDAGKFSDEWRPFRELAQRGGLIFPPEGTRWDSWEDDEPSQRAILIRAIRETPELLRTAIIGAHSWSTVIHRLLKGRDDMREDAMLREKDDAWARRDDVSPRQSMQSIASIFGRIRESLP